MVCAERSRLLAEFERTVAVYYAAVRALDLCMNVAPYSRLNKLQKAADKAFHKCELARLALERHTTDHGC